MVGVRERGAGVGRRRRGGDRALPLRAHRHDQERRTPRISSIETHLVGDDLVVVMIPKTRKAADVRRDDRVTLQSPITDAANPGAEYKLRGRALTIESDRARESAASAVEARSGWRPRPAWLFLSILLSGASFTAWSPDGTAVMRRWDLARGAVETRKLELDMEAGVYRSK